ncbi:SAM-dependent methyltransferase [Aurantimonas sp. C2-6-R+9]|uniref:SAM-dependent methyltransferase n=1 Tax=Aurantimonas sp. C2-6-R+9 TaxID=3114365 RepID=UPI003FA44421
MSAATGTLYGLGVGPGDPELITLKALRLLKAAPVVAYPAPDHGRSTVSASGRATRN